MRAYLHLEDGTILEGNHFGFAGDSDGEVVFTTGMTGYPESLTDPSFAGQILTFTYPLLGNYGVPKMTFQAPHVVANFESERIWAKGVIVSTLTDHPSHFDAQSSLSDWLRDQKVPGVSGIDTRALTQKLREHGVLRGRISQSAEKQDISGWTFPRDIVAQVSHPTVMDYHAAKPNGKRLLLIDCGVKHGILRAFLDRGFALRRIPWDADPLKYMDDVDGVICSNGPGDPKDCVPTIANIKKVLEHDIPYIGICLGHQLLALAIGADTYKLKYGHRGLNQPCQDMTNGKCYVTSQNHGYAVNVDTIPDGFIPWFKNLNDHTNEGLKHETKKVYSTQFHPEGNPGPFDSDFLFTLLK